ncbi:MAG: hypothetical protein NZ959_03245 [Armatimonadetes bacterium]|nr:hypothetical protein [Armatimonadota bacterium]MDW8121325.1 hypothetical protein [Armatimonadota bacterium]
MAGTLRNPHSKKRDFEEEWTQLLQALSEKGVQVLTGRWAGKAGWAILKGRPILVIDRGLLPEYKRIILRTFLDWLNGKGSANESKPSSS